VLGFVGKPYRPDQLAAAVRSALDRRPEPAPALATSLGDDRDYR
jgi:hypothetical protein